MPVGCVHRDSYRSHPSEAFFLLISTVAHSVANLGALSRRMYSKRMQSQKFLKSIPIFFTIIMIEIDGFYVGAHEWSHCGNGRKGLGFHR